MRMQESTVSVDDGAGQLRLSGSLSEWLFSSKFWSGFNAQYSTIFDQFEEDEADVPIVKAVAEALDVRMRALRKLDESRIDFVYRRTPERSPLTTSIRKETLLSELEIFRDFLIDAASKGNRVSFSL